MMRVAKRIALRTSDEARNTTSSAGRRSASGFARFQAQPAEDVLDVDDGVVHQRADRDREAAERHGVERAAEGGEHEDAHDERQRDGDGGDERRAEVAEEQEQDDEDEDRAVAQRDRDVVDRDLDEVGLPEVLLLDDDTPGQGAARGPRAPGRGVASASSVLAPGCFCTLRITAGRAR